jgi:hypothetical protein
MAIDVMDRTAVRKNNATTPSTAPEEAARRGIKDQSEYPRHDWKSRSEFMLAVLRATRKRAELLMADIDEIGVSLKLGMISPEAAATWAQQVGADHFMPTEINGGLITIEGHAE